MIGRADIVAHSPQREPSAVIELKNRRQLTPEVAVTLRRNIIAHGLLPNVPFFMVLSQDVGYLWPGSDQSVSVWHAQPTLQFPMGPVVRRYLPGLDAGERVDEAQLRLLVLQWLTDLSSLPQSASSEPERLLGATGFLEALKGANAFSEVLA
jgi:hypothetical protein